MNKNLIDSFDENKVKCIECKKYTEKNMYNIKYCNDCVNKIMTECFDRLKMQPPYKFK